MKETSRIIGLLRKSLTRKLTPDLLPIRMDRRKLHERDIANHRIITKKLNTKIDTRLTANKQNRITIIPIIVSNQITRNLGFRHKNKIKRLNKSKQGKQAYFHKQTC
nr:MAG TPA: hypothetical protein [Microviridae sp.]